MNNEATAKIEMIERSMRCFAFGLIALLPVIGLPFVVLALSNGGWARVQEKLYWNPARPYRILGVLCASLGTIFWFLVAGLIVLNSVSNCGFGGIGDMSGGGDE